MLTDIVSLLMIWSFLVVEVLVAGVAESPSEVRVEPRSWKYSGGISVGH